VNPDDRRALSELGYAAYFAKDFSLAEEATRKAIERSSDPGIKGGDLYNLGLIQVAQGKNADAIASYTRSLEARPNRTVREALSTLDSAAAARFDPINPITLDGPFASLDAWCQVASKDETVMAATNGCFTNLEKDYANGLDGPLKAAKVKAPYKEVKVVALTGNAYSDEPITTFTIDAREVLYNLAIQADKGWYVQHNGVHVYNPGAFGVSEDAEFSSIEVKDAIPGGQPEIIYQYKHHASDSDMAGALARYSTREETVICGVGASGALSCTNPIVTKAISGLDASLWEAELGPLTEKEFRSEWTLSLTFTTDGQIELKQGTLKEIKSLPKETKAGLGKRALNFP
jgi:tetratricopeptide (TPR) repeat protein